MISGRVQQDFESEAERKLKDLLPDQSDQRRTLSKAFEKRREWAEKYGITSRTLYELFSEFVSMIMLSQAPKQKYKVDDPLNSVFPITHDQKMSKVAKDKASAPPVKIDISKMEIPI